MRKRMTATTASVIIASILGSGILIVQADDWNPLNPANAPSERHGHSMVTLPDGRVILFGGEGYQGDLQNDLFVYNDDGWAEIIPENDPPPARKEHQSWVQNNKLFVFGGYGVNGPLNDLWIYDYTSTNTWTQSAVSNPPPPRSGHSTTTISDGTTVILGGIDENGQEMNDFWQFTGSGYQQLPHCPLTYSNHSAHSVNIQGEEVLLVFGEPGAVGMFRFAVNTWHLVSGGPALSGYSSSVEGENARGETVIFIFGGKDELGNESDVVYEYDTATGELAQREERLPYPVHNHASAKTSKGWQQQVLSSQNSSTGLRILLFGGISNGSVISTTLQSSSVAPDLSSSTKRVNPDTVSAGHVMTYTVQLVNSGILSATVALTDTLPGTLVFQGTPTASSGDAPVTSADTLTWTGTVTDDATVTITYAARLSSTTTLTPTAVNEARIDDGAGNVYTRRAFVNACDVFLPLVVRNSE